MSWCRSLCQSRNASGWGAGDDGTELPRVCGAHFPPRLQHFHCPWGPSQAPPLHSAPATLLAAGVEAGIKTAGSETVFAPNIFRELLLKIISSYIKKRNKIKQTPPKPQTQLTAPGRPGYFNLVLNGGVCILNWYGAGYIYKSDLKCGCFVPRYEWTT